jgi:hypothetical protein
VESGGDVSIMAMEMNESHQSLNTYYDNFGGGWRWGSGFGTATTTETTYQVGTLVVDLFDSSTRRLIWRGSAMKAFSSKTDKNIKNLNQEVSRMFEHFPLDPSKRAALHQHRPVTAADARVALPERGLAALPR